MRSVRSLVRPVAATSAIAFLILAAGCSKPAGTSAANPASSAPQASSATPGKTASRLGDLSAFRSIAANVAAIVDQDDLPAAKARIKDLEVAWDSAEAGLKPRSPQDWHTVDKAIDRALAALRADAPTQSDCKNAMSSLLKTFDSV
jgi:hypothetical protein